MSTRTFAPAQRAIAKTTRRFQALALVVLAAMVAVLCVGAKPASASELSYFYCYAPNPETGATYVSDVHPVGPMAERRHYGDEFAGYLRAKGLLREGGVGYCVMRATMAEIDRDRREMAQTTCLECAGAEKMTDVAWRREGDSTIHALLIGKAAPLTALEGAKAEAKGEREGEFVVTVYVRDDETDALYSAEPGGAEIAKAQTEERGGKWHALTVDNHACTGWWAVSYADSKDHRRYWMQGSDTEEEAVGRAGKIASTVAKGKGEGWGWGIALVFRSPILERHNDSGVINYLKRQIRPSIEGSCSESKDSACMCVRG